MAQPSAPPLQDKSAPPSHQDAPVAPCYPEPPPPYTPNDPGVSAGPAPAAQPTGPYLQQAPVPVMTTPPVQPPVQMVVAPAPQPSQVIVVGAGLAPGTCTVCRNGKMKNSASFWTWLCCCILLPFGILPAVIVFCCCCRGPKCTKCGYTP